MKVRLSACPYGLIAALAPSRALQPLREHLGLTQNTVVRSESVRNIIRERRMLEHVNHPFICNLRYSFQDIEYMYAIP